MLPDKFFFERLLAGRMLDQTDTGGRISRPIVRVAVIGIAVGMLVMIVTLGVMNGFQGEIRNKVIGFGSHIRISGYDTNDSWETDSIKQNLPEIQMIRKISGIRHVQAFATKAGIMKSGDQLLGVVLKGVGRDFEWSFFEKKLVSGKSFTLPDTTTDAVLVSNVIAKKMNLEVGKKFRMFFLKDNRSRPRAFRVSGIYETGLESFDDKFILADLRQVQKLNDWDSSLVGGFEIATTDYNRLEALTEEVRENLPIDLNAANIRELQPQIFSWLDLLDTNALIIIVLMLFVSMINMISALIILILDRTNMIGLLKALGAQNQSVMRIFLMHAARLIGKGLLMGNALGLLLCWIQYQFEILHLDQASYYVDAVPVDLVWWHVLALNAAALILCMLALYIPARIITRVSPVRAIRYN